MRTDDESLLLFIYKNAEMGKSSVPYLRDKAEDGAFRGELDALLREYCEIYSDAELMLADIGNTDPKGLSVRERLASEASVRMGAAVDPTVSNYADMLIKGAAMGVTDISEQMNRYAGASAKTVALAERLKRCNENVIDRMKGYLSALHG